MLGNIFHKSYLLDRIMFNNYKSWSAVNMTLKIAECLMGLSVVYYVNGSTSSQNLKSRFEHKL